MNVWKMLSFGIGLLCSVVILAAGCTQEPADGDAQSTSTSWAETVSTTSGSAVEDGMTTSCQETNATNTATENGDNVVGDIFGNDDEDASPATTTAQQGTTGTVVSGQGNAATSTTRSSGVGTTTKAPQTVTTIDDGYSPLY